MWVPITLIIGSLILLLDAVVSLLYYLKRDGETWRLHHPVRVMRGLWAMAFLFIGIILL